MPIDPETGVTYQQFTVSGDRWNKHAYTDISAWSPDGNLLAYASGFDDYSLPCDVCISIPDSDMRLVLATDGHFNRHNGCMVKWAPDGRGIYYRSRVAGAIREKYVGLDRQSRLVGPFLRHIHPDGTRALYREFGQADEYKIGSGNDLCLLHLDSGDARVLVKYADILALSKRLHVDPYPSINNCIWSPDGKKVLISTTNSELFVARPWCGRMRLTHIGLGGHRSWHPDSKHVVFMGRDEQTWLSTGLCIVNLNGGDFKVISNDRAVYGTPGSHPIFSPDGKLIASESYGAPLGLSIVVIDYATGQSRKLVNVGTTHGYEKPMGTSLHPIWSNDGTQILYDSDATGRCQIYIADVPASWRQWFTTEPQSRTRQSSASSVY